MADSLTYIPKCFVYDTSLLYNAGNVDASSWLNLNNYFNKISNCVFQWKMSFSPDPIKQKRHTNSFLTEKQVKET